MKAIELESIIARSAELAELMHAGQFRRDGVTPYIEHPRKVADIVGKMLAKHREDPDRNQMFTAAVSAAWLHDVLEDTPCTVEAMLGFGIPRAVVDCVDILTRKEGQPYAQYMDGVKHGQPLASVVKFADMLANFSDSPTAKQQAKYLKAFGTLLGW